MRAIFTTLLLSIMWPINVSASPITVLFTGVISEDIGTIPVRISGTFAAGDIFTGVYSYDSELPVFYSQTGTSVYNGVSKFEVSINGLDYSSDTAHIEVSNDVNARRVDSIIVNTGVYPGTVASITGPEVDNLPLHSFGLDFRDQSGAALNGTELPVSAPDLSLFGSSYVSFLFYDYSRGIGYPFWGKITSSSTISQVPVPPASSMLLSGITLGVIAIRRRSKTPD